MLLSRRRVRWMKGDIFMKKITTKALAYDAVLAALYYALSLVSLNLGNEFKISFASLPILVGAFLFGPTHGCLIALVGTFLEQALGKYGLMLTTPLWMLPYIIRGLVAGGIAKMLHFDMKHWQIALATVLSGFVLTIANILPLWVNSIMYHLNFVASVIVPIPMRLVIQIVAAVLYCIILIPLIPALKKVLHMK